MAKKTRLTPSATPGRRYTFVPKTVIPPTPSARKYIIPAEDRTIVIEAESRTVVITA